MPAPRNDAERRAAWWYRLRGYRILDTNCWLARRRARPRRPPRPHARLLRGEVEAGRRVRRPARDGDAPRRCAACGARRGVARRASRVRGLERALRRDRRARRPARARRRTRSEREFGRAVPAASNPRLAWRGDRRTQTLRRASSSISTSRGRSASCRERERTKHVHRLHPYLGKYIPQLVEELLRRHVPAGGRVLDPFAGSGTTLVQALESGHDSVGVDIAAFNCLLMRVKTREHNPFVLERELRDALARFERGEGDAGAAVAHTCARGSRRGRATSCCASARSPPTTRRGRAARRARARGTLGPADDPLRPRLPARAADSSRTGATSTGASAGPSSTPTTSCGATRSTRSRG